MYHILKIDSESKLISHVFTGSYSACLTHAKCSKEALFLVQSLMITAHPIFENNIDHKASDFCSCPACAEEKSKGNPVSKKRTKK